MHRGHAPLALEEELPWRFRQLVIGSGCIWPIARHAGRAILSLVAATSAVAHRRIAPHNAAADTQRSSLLPARSSPPAGFALLPTPPRRDPLVSATAVLASTPQPPILRAVFGSMPAFAAAVSKFVSTFPKANNLLTCLSVTKL